MALGEVWQISPHKSLAPYRECRGVQIRDAEEDSGRGTFDRDDLKEAAGRAMEPLACSWSFEVGIVGSFARLRLGKATIEIFDGAETSR